MRAPNPIVSTWCSLPLFAVLLACGGPAPELALEGPSSLSLAWGGSEAVELTLERSASATGDLTLSVEGLPEGVTARFEPETVAGDVLAATLHLEAARDAAAKAALVTVRATGADALVAEHVFLLEVSGLTVTGTVTSILGDTVPVGVPVKVGSQWVATDGEGTFVAHNVATPYDLVIRGASLTEVYMGLTSPTPRVNGFLDESVLAEWPSVNLQLTLTPTPMAHEVIDVCPSGVHPLLSRCSFLRGDGVSNTLSMSVALHGGPSVARRLVARRAVVSPSGGRTTAYTGLGAAAVPYAPGLSVAFDLELSRSSSTAVSYAIQMPEIPAAVVDRRYGRVAFGDLLNGERMLAPDVFHLPEGATGAISVVREDPTTKTFARTVWPVDGPLDGPITFRTPIRALTPEAGSVLTRTTEFRTSDPEGALVSHLFNVESGADRAFVIHTFEDHLSFSSLETLLEDVVPSDLVHWTVVSTPQVKTPEQATEEDVGYLALMKYTLGGGILPPSEPVQMSNSFKRTFSTPVGGSSAPSLHERLEALLLQ